MNPSTESVKQDWLDAQHEPGHRYYGLTYNEYLDARDAPPPFLSRKQIAAHNSSREHPFSSALVIGQLCATALHLYAENERLREALLAIGNICPPGVVTLAEFEEFARRTALAAAARTEEEFCEANEGAA